jgi:ankyrin repeat protein
MKFIILSLVGASLLSNSFLFAGINEDLITASKQGNLEGVKTAVTNGAAIESKDEDGNTALSHSFFWPDITQYLIQNKADPNGGEFPALIPACSHYSTKVIKLLLDAGADPNKIGMMKTDPGAEIRAKIAKEKEKGFSANSGNIAQWERMLQNMQVSKIPTKAMDVTVRETNCVPCIEMLVASGANTKPKDDYGQGSFIHSFAMFGMPAQERSDLIAQEVDALVGSGYKVPDWMKSLPADRNFSEAAMIKALVAVGINIDATNARGQTALHQTINGERGIKTSMMEALVENGANMSLEDPVYGTPLIMALKSGDVKLMQYMIDQGADISIQSKEVDKETGQELSGMTPLMIATMYDNFDLVKYLVNKGAKYSEGAQGKAYLNQRDCLVEVRKKTALYFAVDNDNIDMVRWMANNAKLGRPPFIIEMPVNESTSSCFAAGKYKPSSYSRALGSDDIYRFLKVKGW